MKWLENNPVGMALSAICGVLVLVALVLAVAWRSPGQVDVDTTGQDVDDNAGPAMASLVLGDEEQYQVINDRPLFNESRRPEVIEVIEDDGDEEAVEVVEAEVANRPDVRLTGVVITPEARFVTLTPNQGDGKPVTVSPGTALEDKYVGWKVEAVGARQVNLASARGEKFDLELAVYDTMIEAPPEPEPRPVPGLAGEEAPGEEGEMPEEDGERLSRAEEIRQRIAERREQLRQEAEQEAEQAEDQRSAQRNDYQEAMRAMMNRHRPNEENENSNDE